MIDLIDAEHVVAALPWPVVVGALRAGFAAGDETTVPQRHHHDMGACGANAANSTLLLMPAWNPTYAGVKIAAVFPGNRGTDTPTINGNYLLLDGATGVPLALLDGGALTVRRTAGASLLAATLLARPDSARLVVLGSGRLAGNLARGYAELFPIDEIVVWNHRLDGAERLAAELSDEGFVASATADPERAVASADIVTAATLSSDPVVAGRWLRPGTHVDLVGGFTPAMREADDDAIRAADVYVDTLAGALTEAGDIMQPIATGALTEDAILGDLFALCAATPTPTPTPGGPLRASDSITMFKSVGHALEDLVAAAAVYESNSSRPR